MYPNIVKGLNNIIRVPDDKEYSIVTDQERTFL